MQPTGIHVERPSKINRFNKVWIYAFLGAALYWLSLPPLKLPWAAFFASAFWVAIVAKENSPTRREYMLIWLAGVVLWLALLQGIRLAFWPLYAGWMALSLYLAVYLPLFVAISRSLYHHYRLPLAVSVSVVWVGLELIRAYFVTGFAACMLGHSQVPWTWMLQIASHFGGYGVSFIVMFIGALAFQIFNGFLARKSPSRKIELHQQMLMTVIPGSLILATVGFEIWSLNRYERWIAEQSPIKPLARVLLVQEDMPTMFDGDINDVAIGWKRYEWQTSIASEKLGDNGVDLVVWPESTFSIDSVVTPDGTETRKLPWIDLGENPGLPEGFSSRQKFEEQCNIIEREIERKAKRIQMGFGTPKPKLLLGNDVYRFQSGTTSIYNAALWIDGDKISETDYYAKQHLVMFGEYIPLASSVPQLMQWIGLGQIESGDAPKSWRLPSGTTVSPSICFEDVLPQLIQSHVRQLTSMGRSPDLLVNITNDGWFRGSSILDHHLNNAVLVAVENRRPMLIAANLGISAWIDGNGRIVQSLPRLESGSILAEPIPDGRWGLWQSIGDWPARFAALVCCLPILQRIQTWRKNRRVAT